MKKHILNTREKEKKKIKKITNKQLDKLWYYDVGRDKLLAKKINEIIENLK